MKVIVVLLVASLLCVSSAPCQQTLPQLNTEYEGAPYHNLTLTLEACCNWCDSDTHCTAWVHRSSNHRCELRTGTPLIMVNGTCSDASPCQSGIKRCGAGNKQQILDMALSLVITAENFSGACYIIEHSFPAVGFGFWLDKGAAVVMESLLNITDDQYHAIEAGTRNISESDGITLAVWMLNDLYKDVIVLMPSFETSLPLPVQAIIVDIAYNVGIAGLKKQFSKLIECVGTHDYSCIINQMVTSKWYSNEPARSSRDVSLLRRITSICNTHMTYRSSGTTTALACDRSKQVPATTYSLNIQP